MVLAKGEGALGVMAPIFKLGGASPVGNGGHRFKPANGRQWMSWIHSTTSSASSSWPSTIPRPEGPINGSSPNPSRNVDFSRALAKVLHRPFLPFGPPDLMLEVMLGEVAKTVTKGQRVLPTPGPRNSAIGSSIPTSRGPSKPPSPSPADDSELEPAGAKGR